MSTTTNDNLLSTSLPSNQRLYRPRLSNTPTGQSNNAVDGRTATKPGRLLAAKWIEQQQRRSSANDSSAQRQQGLAFFPLLLLFLSLFAVRASVVLPLLFELASINQCLFR